MKRANYREGIAWIALINIALPDFVFDPMESDEKNIPEMICVKMLADLFSVSEEKIAEDVKKYRAQFGSVNDVFSAIEKFRSSAK
jgi:hypothetical protein